MNVGVLPGDPCDGPVAFVDIAMQQGMHDWVRA
jgi:hypothetical protein